MALIPPFFFDCVVAIGERSADKKENFSATGFLYGKLVQKSAQPEQDQYRLYLVTNRHVLAERDTVILRFNALDPAPARTFDLELHDSQRMPIYSYHPDSEVDVVVIPINSKYLKDEGIRFSFFAESKHAVALQNVSLKGISEGDGVFLLGFPMGDVGRDQNYVIARQGIVARIRDAIAGTSKYYLVDSAIFPGNSGGPVVTKPEVVSIQGTNANGDAMLIGIVSAYLPYQDVAISVQTKRPRIIFEENSGLGVVFPVDCVIAAVDVAEQKLAKGADSSVGRTTAV